jgi:hypothetical protein
MRNADGRDAEKGAIRPIWLALGLVACVVVGTSVNKCLSCNAPAASKTAALPPVDSEPINAIEAVVPQPVPEPVPDRAPKRAVTREREPGTEPGTEPAAGKAAPAPVVATEEETGEDPLAGSLGPIDMTPKPLPKLPPTPRPAGLADHKDVTFDFLADYTYEYPEPGAEPKEQIPEKIRAFQGKQVAVKGFMIPVRTEGDQVKEFILVRNQMACCYGAVPRMNEWLHVKMAKDRTAPYAVDIPITVFGTLDVGEVYEDGIVMSLYRMESTDVIEPPILR